MTLAKGTPDIIRGSDQMFTTLYEGNGGGQKVGKFVPFTDNGTIAKSLIINDGDNAFLSRTNDSGDRTRATVSFWVKRAHLSGNINYIFTSYDGSSSNDGYIRFNTDNTISTRIGTGSSHLYVTNRSFEDTSKWYHIVLAVNTNDSTANDRVKLYVDGDLLTSYSSRTNPGQGDTTQFNYSSATFRIGSTTGGAYDFDGYLAEFNYIDGTTYEPSTFGLTDTSTGRWIPKTLTGITYGTNGHRLEFANSAGQTIGDDTSGNTNDFSVTNSVAGDITTDSPTQNHATLQGTGGTISEGNLKLVTGNSEQGHHNATLKPKSGKYYAEFTCNAMGRSEVGVVSNLLVPYPTNTTRMPATPDGSIAGLMYYGYNGKVYNDSGNGTAATFNTYTTNDIIGIALDLDNLTVQFFKNNTSEGTLPIPTSNYIFAMGDGATGYGGGWTANFGQKSFTYTAPTGFVALQQDNLPETSKGIPDLVWIKNRDATDDHQLYDSTRGPLKVIEPNTTVVEETDTDGLQKFLVGGSSVEDDARINTNGESYVSWNWVANGGTTSANTDGSGATLASTIQANQTAGFSIVQVTAPSSPSGTYKIAHGLGAAPEWIIGKNLENSGGYNWSVYHHKVASDPATDYLELNTSDALADDATVWGDTTPTSSVFTIGTGVPLLANEKTIFYCWTSIPGYSKFGSYEGNANSNGPFINLGFKPSLLIIKNIDRSVDWVIIDDIRNPNNVSSSSLLKPNANSTESEASNQGIDLLSNGFKVKQSSSNAFNASSQTHIYMAFAKHPFLGDGTNPATAK